MRQDAHTLKLTLLTATATATTALIAAGTAIAQDAAPAPDTTPPSALIKISTITNSLDALIGSGLTFSVDPSEDVSYTATATIKSKGKTVVVAKSIRSNDIYNQSGGFIEQTIPHGSNTAAKTLIKIKRGKKAAVTLTLSLSDTAGNKATVKKTVTLKKRY